MQATRQLILSHLQRHPGASVGDLAAQLGMSLGTVRHHLTVLEREGLVVHRLIRQDVGRPRMAYSLSERGEESFPKQYDRLSAALLAEIKVHYGEEALNELVRGAARRLVEAHGLSRLPIEALEARAQILATLMDREGFSLEWGIDQTGMEIRQHICPYMAVAGEHPEVCLFDRELIRSALGRAVTQFASRMRGDAYCPYRVDLEA